MSREQTPAYLLKTHKKAIEGLRKHLPARIQSLSLGGRLMTIPKLISYLQGYVDKGDAVKADERKLKNDRRIRKEADPRASRDLRDLYDVLITILGMYSPDLEYFGFRPVKRRRKLTNAESVAKVQKMRATRAARHTMGPKQKKGIKG